MTAPPTPSPAAAPRRLAHWAHRPDLRWVLAVLLVVCGVWAFVALADEMSDGDLQPLDERIILSLRVPGDPADPIGPRWFEEAVRDLTALGGPAVVTLVTVSVAGFLLIQRRRAALALLLASVLGAVVMSFLLKDLFDRPRPDLVAHGTEVLSSSFPSGHSMVSAAVYLTLGALLARLSRPARLKLYVLTVAFFITGLVGASRVYLGVHYPSDVLAGWAAGLAWAALCGSVVWWLQRRGRLTGPLPGPLDPDDPTSGQGERQPSAPSQASTSPSSRS